jgi:hypothetical protein
LAAKRRRRRKEALRRGGGEDEFADLEPWRTEVDQESVLDLGGPEIAQELGDVLIGQSAHCLQFDDEAASHEEIR